MPNSSEMQLFDPLGQRLYLTPEERKRFAEVATTHSPNNEARTLCRLVCLTGCRISEALELTSDRVDFVNKCIVFRSLKKHRNKQTGAPTIKHRAVPVPDSFLDELNLVHNLKSLREPVNLWGWSRATGWRCIKNIMAAADIQGAHANPKGLRHGFGVAYAMKQAPLPSIQKWLGHESLETTAIYLQAVGDEERELAARAWD